MKPKILAYTIKDACRVTGLGRTSVYAAVKAGALSVRKCGRRTLILAADLEQFLQTLPTSSRRSPASEEEKIG